MGKNLEKSIDSLQTDISEKISSIECDVLEKEHEHEREKQTLEEELHLKIDRVIELEEESKAQKEYISNIEERCKNLKEEALSSEKNVSERIHALEASMSEKEAALVQLKEAHKISIESLQSDNIRLK